MEKIFPLSFGEITFSKDLVEFVDHSNDLGQEYSYTIFDPLGCFDPWPLHKCN
jgi:hypothetical protein